MMRVPIAAVAVFGALSLAACGGKEEAEPAAAGESQANARAAQMQAAADAAKAAAEEGADAIQTAPTPILPPPELAGGPQPETKAAAEPPAKAHDGKH